MRQWTRRVVRRAPLCRSCTLSTHPSHALCEGRCLCFARAWPGRCTWLFLVLIGVVAFVSRALLARRLRRGTIRRLGWDRSRAAAGRLGRRELRCRATSNDAVAVAQHVRNLGAGRQLVQHARLPDAQHLRARQRLAREARGVCLDGLTYGAEDN